MKKIIFSLAFIVLLCGCENRNVLREKREKILKGEKETEEKIDITSENTTENEEKTSTLNDVKENKVNESFVYGVINEDCDVFSYYDEGGIIGKFEKDEKVEVLRDRGYEWYLVNNENKNINGWIYYKYLDIEADNYKKPEFMSRDELEEYVNEMGYESDTEKLVWVDIERQRVNIFEGKKGKWGLIKELDCASGKNVSSTIKGEFEIGDRGEWFYSERLGSGAMWWVRIEDDYLFH
ncbi:MAG: hypothetical protein IJ583_12535 [Firmicutes bacterium]|nr:hypothetical protein [Bacillota bacterium]